MPALIGTRQDAILGRRRSVPALADTFTRSDTATGIGLAGSGHDWAFDDTARIVGGRMRLVAADGAAYCRLHLGARVVRLAATIRFSANVTAAPPNNAAVALLCSHGAGPANFGGTGAWF